MKNTTKIGLFFFLISSLSFAQTQKCLVTEALTTKEGNPQYRISSEYDKLGNLISLEMIQYAGQTAISSKTINEYNAQNKVIKKQIYFNNTLTKTTNFQYDNLGKLLASSETKGVNELSNTAIADNFVTQVFYNENGTIASKETAEKTGNTEKTTKIDAQNKVTSKETKVFSTRGKVLEKENEDVIGNVNKKTKYEYETNDKLLKEEEFLNNELIGYGVYQYANDKLSKYIKYTKTDQEDYRLEYAYDANGNLSQVSSFYRKVLSSRTIKSYDEKNNVILETNFGAEGQIINEIRYKYNCQ